MPESDFEIGPGGGAPPGVVSELARQAGREVWVEVEKRIDQRTQYTPGGPRIFAPNWPFGVPGTVDVVASPVLVGTLGFDFPALIMGYRVWTSVSGSATFDVRLVGPARATPLAETSIVPVAGLPHAGTWTPSEDTSGWAQQYLHVRPYDILRVYMTAAASITDGVFWLRLRDETVQPVRHGLSS